MPVTEKVALSYTDLGVAGASLLLVLIFIILIFYLIFKLIKNFQSSLNTVSSNADSIQTKGIDKLCTKIDALITSQNEYIQKLNSVLICNEKDQISLIKLLEHLQATAQDIQRRIVRVDDRTFKCLGNVKKLTDGSDINEDN